MMSKEDSLRVIRMSKICLNFSFLSFLDLHLYNDLLLATWEKAKDSGHADIKWLKDLCKDEYHLKP